MTSTISFAGLLIFWGCIFLSGAVSCAEPTCASAEVVLPIEFQFLDQDAQYEWVYASLSPRLKTPDLTLEPSRLEIHDGKMNMEFCLKEKDQSAVLEFLFGPRALSVAPRSPVRPSSAGAVLPQVFILRQKRPDWVIVKSYQRSTVNGSDYPVFDLELYNFGTDHNGGQVHLTVFEHGWMCDVGSPPKRIVVSVAMIGKRIRVSSADPEFPEDQLVRTAELITASANDCAGNYDLNIDLGKTGVLHPGPTHIRYIFRDTTPPSSQGLAHRFKGRSYHLYVSGEGIWSPKPLLPF
jgi:hypothetical protein